MPAEWNGSVVVWPKRILFVGEAAKSRVHASHTLMVIVACKGKFSLKIGSKGRWEPFAAAIIDARTRHCMDGKGAEFVAIIHLLPETEEARELRREYLAKRGWYGIPAGPARKLSARLEALQDYWLLNCKNADKFFRNAIGEFIESSSSRLSRKVDFHVRRAINELYSRMEQRLEKGKSAKDSFTSSSITRKLHLDKIGWDSKDLEREFRESTGATFNAYVKLLRFRATLVKLALNQAELRAAPTRRRRISLTAAAKWMGWDTPSSLTHASIEILGINPNSLRVDSGFLNCRTRRGQ